MKKKFKIGDRVRELGTEDKGTVVTVDDEWVMVEFDRDLNCCNTKSELLIRLKPKKKVKGREIYVGFLENGMTEVFNNYPAKSAVGDFAIMREVLPGEVFVSRESLAKAWDSKVSGYNVANADKSVRFKDFCKALGLPEEKGE